LRPDQSKIAFAVKHAATLLITEKTTLIVEGLGEGRFKINSTCFDGGGVHDPVRWC
jgi:hypothetical protein